ncbi:YqgE/AlgH family protein [Roseiconus lacunae]|uniref:YqgE/AlgH family protein n=1 Tax=Roseiconus lacunae TaxID=2605694 RepID=UPI0011F355BA|nr:YqgE/AlgH family protein [Roseiconus lacunae]MCD0458718.1 YqgE/AlgH family protein [Roseiconus lacunae]WRQ50217.1 YqgE/AlgH family protein [Stieleria sp. HD01]
MSESLSGRLLIASPYLSDPNFMRTVVLIVNHDDEGAFGLTLTRPTAKRLSEVIELSMPSGAIREDDFIFEGGPVEGPLLAIHDLSDIGAPIDEEGSGVWLTGDEDQLRLLLQRTDAKVRFVAQYSGWGPGQLDTEMRSGGWLVGRADAKTVFSDPDQIWESAVKRCGHEILSSISPGLQFSDPSVN